VDWEKFLIRLFFFSSFFSTGSTLEINSQMGDKGEQGTSDPFVRRGIMKKLQPGDQIVRTDKELGIAWILLPPDAALGGFRGISPRIMNEEKFIMAKKKMEKKKG
jgi:hypothetical protein